jgi:flagellar hook assembly protein FlgD
LGVTALGQNYPNPFNPETWIPYQLAKPGEIVVKIYDASGRLVRTIELGYKKAGLYSDKSQAVYWDGRNQQGEAIASGIYFYQLKAGSFVSTRKMVMVK